MLSFFRKQSGGTAFSGAVCSDVGLCRDNNEDNYLLGTQINRHSASRSSAALKETAPILLAAVFDGIGGGDKGELASLAAAKVFRGALKPVHTPDPDAIDEAVRQAFLDANNAVLDLRVRFRVAGTTGTVLCCCGDKYKFYQIGDSRGYLLRSGGLTQRTTDQTLEQLKADAGIYSPEDPTRERDRHVLTEFIGRDQTRQNLMPQESDWLTLRPGDTFLLCSDGLYGMCADAEIRAILNTPDSLKEQAAQLTQAAIRAGGEDNITCLLVRADGKEN